MNGTIDYTARPGHGRSFQYEVVRLWERPAEELLAGDIGVAPLAVLGRLPEDLLFEEAIKAVAERIVERLTKDAPPDRAKKLLTDALLLTWLRVKRDVAARIFRGVQMMEESDTYLMILERGEEKQAKEAILLVGEERLGPPDESIKAELIAVTDLNRLRRLIRRAAKATTWREILDTP